MRIKYLERDILKVIFSPVTNVAEMGLRPANDIGNLLRLCDVECADERRARKGVGQGLHRSRVASRQDNAVTTVKDGAAQCVAEAARTSGYQPNRIAHCFLQHFGHDTTLRGNLHCSP
jgi:hypothetical protein